MRRTAQSLAVLGLLLLIGRPTLAADDEVGKIIDKAIKAHFPNGLDAKMTGLRSKSKGTLHIMGNDLTFNQEVAAQIPDKFKETMDLNVMGNNVPVVTVFNGKEGWILANGKEVKVTDEILAEFKEAAYSMGVMQGMYFKQKGIKFALTGEVKVNGKPAIGVTVSKEGKKDINVFFDKETGLMAKIEMRKRDQMSGEEVNEERIVTEYQDVAGRKVAKRVEVLRGGKPFIELEVTELKIEEKLDDGEFAQPK